MAHPADGPSDHLPPRPPDRPSIQQRLYPQVTCFGCGPANPKGLQLRSFPDPSGGVLADFSPWPEHDNGGGFLNGGIIATVLDCHTGAAVVAEAERLGLLDGLPDGLLAFPYVTAGIEVRYVRPCPLQGPIRLTAVVVSAEEGQMTVRAEAAADDRVRATAEALWKRWRPR